MSGLKEEAAEAVGKVNTAKKPSYGKEAEKKHRCRKHSPMKRNGGMPVGHSGESNAMCSTIAMQRSQEETCAAW
jgi:hypothetical protein